jgi:hypothetical protein
MRNLSNSTIAHQTRMARVSKTEEPFQRGAQHLEPFLSDVKPILIDPALWISWPAPGMCVPSDMTQNKTGHRGLEDLGNRQAERRQAYLA